MRKTLVALIFAMTACGDDIINLTPAPKEEIRALSINPEPAETTPQCECNCSGPSLPFALPETPLQNELPDEEPRDMHDSNLDEKEESNLTWSNGIPQVGPVGYLYSPLRITGSS